jgi:hypothetical protein
MKNSSANRIVVESERSILANQVEKFLARLQPAVSLERGHGDRTAIPYLFRVTPLDDARQPVDDDALTVVGKNLSRRGISFCHERPISHRLDRIELVQPGPDTFVAEIDITWCRFNKLGWYESGGRLIGAVCPASERAAAPTAFHEIARLTTFLELSLPAAWA